MLGAQIEEEDTALLTQGYISLLHGTAGVKAEKEFFGFGRKTPFLCFPERGKAETENYRCLFPLVALFCKMNRAEVMKSEKMSKFR